MRSLAPLPLGLAAALVFAAPVAPLTAQETPTGVTVAGQVVDAATDRPVDGATVVVFPRTTPVVGQGEPDGRFLLRLPPGQYTLWYLRDGYEPARQVLTLDGDTALAPARLAAVPGDDGRRGARVSGVVVDGTTGAPIAEALLEAGERRMAASDAEGRFALRGVPPGETMLRIRRLGYRGDVALLETGEEDASLGLLALERDAIVLEGLTVTVDRLDRRLRSASVGSRVIRAEQIARTSARDAEELVRRRAIFYTRPCSGDGFGRDCRFSRGAWVPVQLYLDEVPLFGGMRSLGGMSAADVGRIEVFGGGSMVRVYSHAYLERAARNRWIPMPIILM